MIIIEDSIEIETTPDAIFDFFRHAENYKPWHPDHIVCQWIKGKPLEEGSINYTEEYAHGKLHKLKVVYTKITPNKEIEFKITNLIWRIFYPKTTFNIEQKGESCTFTAKTYLRLGPIGSRLEKTKKLLRSIAQHMKEEGENLKKILEKNNT